MGRIPYEKLIALQNNPSNIRTVTIIAHVDHGKTSISDLLLADNAVIGRKQAGSLRYLDNRPDEQTRGITMKSSMFALHFHDQRVKQDFLMNLIDSPGHIDFTTEVVSSTRISDGVFIVVDAVEGVRTQTLACIELAIRDECKMILVINKIDKLIMDQNLNSTDIHITVAKVVESMNAAVSDIRYKERQRRLEEFDRYEDSEFDPGLGNVIFASAFDGWAFRLIDFANIQSMNVGTTAAELEPMLWGDYYYNMTTESINLGAYERKRKPLFVSLILDNICSMYESILVYQDRSKLYKMINKLGLHPNRHVMNKMFSREQLRALISEWLPLSTVFFETMVDKMPSPLAICTGKVRRVMQIHSLNEDDRPFSQDLEAAVSTCDARGPVLGYIAKVYPILPQNKMAIAIQKTGALSDIVTRREKCRQIKAEQVRAAIEKAQEAINEVAELSRDPTLELDQSSIELLRNTFPRITDKRSLTSTPLDTPTISQETLHSAPSEGLISFLTEPMSSDMDIPTSESISQENVNLSQEELCVPSTSSANGVVEPLTALASKKIPDLSTQESLTSDINLTASGSASQDMLHSESSQAELNPIVASSIDDPTTLVNVEKLELEESFSIPGCQYEVIAVVRIFSGTLRKGSNLYLINPTHSPAMLNNANSPEMVHNIMRDVKKFPVEELYMILGKDVIDIDSAPAGNIVGLGMLHKYGITARCGTIAGSLDCNPLIESFETAEPFYKCSISPKTIEDYPVLVAGLKMLAQTDSCVQCVLQENGEYIIVTGGHVHLDKCLEDLSLFTGLEFNLSTPTVNLRETLMPGYYDPPRRTTITRSSDLEGYNIKFDTYAHGMPEGLQKIIRINHSILKSYENVTPNDLAKFNAIKESPMGSRIITSIQQYFDTLGGLNMRWDANRVMAVGNSRENCCLLINLSRRNRIGSLFVYPSITEHVAAVVRLLKNAFQLAIQAGPLCEEPVKNVIFIVLDLYVDRRVGNSIIGLHSGALQNGFKKALIRPMRELMPRLCEPIYSSSVTLNNVVLGKLSTCIDQHRGQIISCCTIAEGVTSMHFLIPVLESSLFAESLREATRGVVNPLLEFAHFQMIPECPLPEGLPVNKTEYEVQRYYDARKIMRDIRRRKGLVMDVPVVGSAEKQRTLNKKK